MEKSFLSISSIDYDEQNRLVQELLHALILAEDLNMFELERIVERTRIDLSLTLRNLFVDRFHLCDELEQIREFLNGKNWIYIICSSYKAIVIKHKKSRRVLSRTQGTSKNTPFDFWSCGWANLSIQYKVKYSMEAFFSENCKERYNDIFH